MAVHGARACGRTLRKRAAPPEFSQEPRQPLAVGGACAFQPRGKPPGRRLPLRLHGDLFVVPRGAWQERPSLKAAADVNAVPPAGIEGVEVADNGTERGGATVFGALGIGGLKMKAHRAAVARLFERNDLVLDAEEIYDLAAAL